MGNPALRMFLPVSYTHLDVYKRQELTSLVQDGDLLILDAENGEVIVEPDAETIALVQAKMDSGKRQNLRLAMTPQERAVTKDGYSVDTMVNIGGLDDLTVGLLAGAEGVGLFRTELLYRAVSYTHLDVYKRQTLKPPAVDPPHPPTTIAISKMTCENSGQRAKSAVQ